MVRVGGPRRGARPGGRRAAGTTRRWAAAARGSLLLVAAVAALAACSTPVASSAAPNTSTTAPSAAASPTTQVGSVGAGDGTDLAACADGTCEVEVRPGDTMTFDGSVRVDRLVVTGVEDGQVTVSASTGPGSRSTQSSSVGSENTLNGLSYRILSVRGDTAVLDLSGP